jgi:uncharacterized repeat protein (TIGR01451 family)/LPXTG-motif cell wall-anchored protein
MKALKRWVKRGVINCVPKVFNLIVILALLLQPVGISGIRNVAFAQDDESDTNSAAGSIRVCKIIVDTDGKVVDGSALPGSVFTISGITPDPTTSEGDPVGVLPKSTFTTKLSLNAKILDDSTENDAQCKTYSDLKLGGYYYGEESIPSSGWEGPKYNDQFTVSVQTLNDFFPYDGKLFDGNNSNDESRNKNVDGHIILTTDRPDRMLVILNQYKPIALPTLHISKSNDSGSLETPGSEVKYTIIVTASDNNVTDVKNVEVTDLPPAGFEFIGGTETATQGSLTHAYASPGVWSLGTMTPGQVITLSYRTTISGSQDAGNYEDLAFARGTSVVDDPVLANAGESTPFVGTDVEVVLPGTPADVALTNTVERNVDTKTIHKTKRVLGAATVLPSTGANINTILSALMLLLSGLILMLLGKRSTWMLIKSFRKSMTKIFLFAIVAGGILFAGQSVNAITPSNLSVKIETPKSPVSDPNFKIGFVALDILGRSVTVDCEKKGPSDGSFSTFETIPLIVGGSSGDCIVNNSVMTGDGTYLFHVTATAGSDSETTGDVSVKLVSGTPSTPLNYSRAAGSCTVGFTTANDGLTDKVELYRSLSSTFTADASTLVATSASIGPNVAGTITDPNGDCGGSYFYAIRAVALSGLGSGFVGDENVTIDNEHKNKTKTNTKHVAGQVTTLGAIPVAGGGAAPAGAVEGATTTEGEKITPSGEPSGAVLGEATRAEEVPTGFFNWIKNHPWWSLLWLIIIVLIAYYTRRIYFGKYNENNQPR